MNVLNDHQLDSEVCGAVTLGDKLINIGINHNNSSTNLHRPLHPYLRPLSPWNVVGICNPSTIKR